MAKTPNSGSYRLDNFAVQMLYWFSGGLTATCFVKRPIYCCHPGSKSGPGSGVMHSSTTGTDQSHSREEVCGG